MQVQQVIKNLRDDLKVLQGAVEEISSAIALLEKHTGEAPQAKGRKAGGKKRKKMSAEARAKIAAAAKERWAKKKAEAEK